MDFLKNDAMRTEQKIRTELVRLSAGGRLLRLTEAVSGLTLERALDTRQSVVRQKNELLGMFNVAMQAAAPNQLYKNMLGKIGAKGSIREIQVIQRAAHKNVPASKLTKSKANLALAKS